MVRIHKSYLINLQHVKKWGAMQVELTNGDYIPVGRKYGQDARKDYLDFVKKMAWERGGSL